jgi:mannose-6-phosphate isomerase-like protein (cupin superfamily)
LKVVDPDNAESREITQHGSEHASVTPLTVPAGDAHVVRIRLEPGGVLGRHAGRVDQLFVVVEGEGRAAGPDGESVPVAAGAAVYWAAGEEHETRSDTGLTAIVVEAPGIVPRR